MKLILYVCWTSVFFSIYWIQDLLAGFKLLGSPGLVITRRRHDHIVIWIIYSWRAFENSRLFFTKSKLSPSSKQGTMNFPNKDKENFFKLDRECHYQGCGPGVVRSRRFLGGVGFLTTQVVGVGFFCPTLDVRWIIFYITLLRLQFLLKWYNFLSNFCWNRYFLLCTTISVEC